jgi:hypothetical protein
LNEVSDDVSIPLGDGTNAVDEHHSMQTKILGF